MKELTPGALEAAAKEIGCEVAAIKAVCEVEAPRGGFTSDGKVRVLFERHKFHAFTKGEFDASHPDLSNPKSGGYGPESKQYSRFSRAFALAPQAAMKATSWGKFQIMGFNHAAAGFSTVGEFVDAMKVDEDEQLKAFVRYIKAVGLAGELRSHNWASFASQYNGPAYKKNRYDTKIAAAYKKYKAQEPSQPEPEAKPEPEPVAQPEPVDGGAKNDKPTQASQGGRKSWIATMCGGLTGIGTAVAGWTQNNASLAMVGIICGTVVLIVWMFRQIIIDYVRLNYMSDPNRINVK